MVREKEKMMNKLKKEIANLSEAKKQNLISINRLIDEK